MPGRHNVTRAWWLTFRPLSPEISLRSFVNVRPLVARTYARPPVACNNSALTKQSRSDIALFASSSVLRNGADTNVSFAHAIARV